MWRLVTFWCGTVRLRHQEVLGTAEENDVEEPEADDVKDIDQV